MTLPTEIDQDVKCLECEELMVPDGNGYLICTYGRCSSIDRIGPKVIAALRNQIPPGHTAIPNAELEALREARPFLATNPFPVDAILAHLPPKPDHVAVLRRMAKDNCPHGEERAALEAAIEWGKKLGEKP